MIPGYSKSFELPEQKAIAELPLADQVKYLEEQVRVLRESVDYINRERQRMKSELDSIRHLLSK